MKNKEVNSFPSSRISSTTSNFIYLAVFHPSQVLDCSRYSHGNIKFLEENKKWDIFSTHNVVWVSSHKPYSRSITYSSFYMRVVFNIKGSSRFVPLPTFGCNAAVKGESQRNVCQRQMRKTGICIKHKTLLGYRVGQSVLPITLEIPKTTIKQDNL